MGGSLDIMQINGYKDSGYKTLIGKYKTLVNPESYSIKYNVEINSKKAQGKSTDIASYNQGGSQTINFKILFDGTGILKPKGGGIVSSLESGLAILGSSQDVTEQIANFKKIAYDFNGETHQTPFVQVLWGRLIFNCKLTSLQLNFKLFKSDGTPLRAEADCTFVGTITEEKSALGENKRSPDLTHTRTVKQGDTLPLLCYREYGDSKYYYQIAKFNGLTDIKQLTPGMKLLFPPILKN